MAWPEVQPSLVGEGGDAFDAPDPDAEADASAEIDSNYVADVTFA